MKNEIFCGAEKTMRDIAEHKVKGLNWKTHKYQIVDKNAKYKVKHYKKSIWLLMSDMDLRKIAAEKGLIL